MPIYYIGNMPFGQDELYHFGIKGQKWGVRRFQNSDGTGTSEGKARYSSGESRKRKIGIPEGSKAQAKWIREACEIENDEMINRYVKMQRALNDGFGPTATLFAFDKGKTKDAKRILNKMKAFSMSQRNYSNEHRWASEEDMKKEKEIEVKLTKEYVKAAAKYLGLETTKEVLDEFYYVVVDD